MPTTTKENTLLILALVIIYFGVYQLTQASDAGLAAKETRWAGLFSVTLGVATLLAIFLGRENLGTGIMDNLYLIIAGVSLGASAYYNYRVAKSATTGNLRYVVYGNLVAHVLLVITYFMNFGNVEQSLGLRRSPTLATPAAPLSLNSLRLPLRGH